MLKSADDPEVCYFPTQGHPYVTFGRGRGAGGKAPSEVNPGMMGPKVCLQSVFMASGVSGK